MQGARATSAAQRREVEIAICRREMGEVEESVLPALEVAEAAAERGGVERMELAVLVVVSVASVVVASAAQKAVAEAAVAAAAAAAAIVDADVVRKVVVGR